MTSLDDTAPTTSGESKIATPEQLLAVSKAKTLHIGGKDTTESVKMLFDSTLGPKFLTPFKVGKEGIIVYGMVPQLILYSPLIKSTILESKDSAGPIPIATHIEITKYPRHFVELWVGMNALGYHNDAPWDTLGFREKFNTDEFFYIRNLFRYFGKEISYSGTILGLEGHIMSWNEVTDERVSVLEQLTTMGKELEIEKQRKDAKKIFQIVKDFQMRMEEKELGLVKITFYSSRNQVENKVLYRKDTDGFGKLGVITEFSIQSQGFRLYGRRTMRIDYVTNTRLEMHVTLGEKDEMIYYVGKGDPKG